MPTNATDSAESLAPEESAKAASNQVAELAATIAEKIRGWTFPEGCSIPKDTPVEVLEALSRHQDEDVRAEIWFFHRTPVSILIELAKDPHEDVRAAVAGNFRTPWSVVETLSKDSSKYVRRNAADTLREKELAVKWVARTSSTWVMQDISALEPDILERLSVYPEEMVRRLVAATPSAPPEMLIALAKDPSEEVRGRVGLNEHAPIEALFLVANDSVPAIRAALAYFRGASLPAEIFAILEADTDQLVQKMVLVARPGRVLARQDAYGDGETDGDGGSGMTGEKAKVLH